MKQRTSIFLLVFIFICACVATAADTKAARDNVKESKRIIVTVSDVYENPATYLNKRIVVVGMFMGVDGACKNPPAARGLNWMLQDSGACLYARGTMPPGCTWRTRMGVGKDVAVEGILRKYPQGYYLQSLMYERIKKEYAEKMKKVLEEHKRQAAMNKKPYAVSEVLKAWDMFEGREFRIRGIYSPHFKCEADVPDEIKKTRWIMKDLDGSCIYLKGPIPKRAGKQVGPETLISLNVALPPKKDGDTTGANYLVSLEKE